MANLIIIKQGTIAVSLCGIDGDDPTVSKDDKVGPIYAMALWIVSAFGALVSSYFLKGTNNFSFR